MGQYSLAMRAQRAHKDSDAFRWWAVTSLALQALHSPEGIHIHEYFCVCEEIMYLCPPSLSILSQPILHEQLQSWQTFSVFKPPLWPLM